MQHAFSLTLEARVGERTRIARELHDTLLQSFHGLLLRFQTAAYCCPIARQTRKRNWIRRFSRRRTRSPKAATRCKGCVVDRRTQRSRASQSGRLGTSSRRSPTCHQPSTFRVGVEGERARFAPIVRDEIYKIAAEALRNSFGHAQAGQVEVEIRYDSDEFRLRVRDDGKGIDQAVLAARGIEGHYGLRGMPERAAVIGGKLAVWSELGAGTEVELRLPAGAVYATSARRSWWSRRFPAKGPTDVEGDAS